MAQSNQDSVTLNILDREYQFSSDEDKRDNLQSAAKFLDRRMKEIRDTGKVVGTERIAVMAALNIAFELLHNSSGSENVQDARVNQLVYRIEEVLESDSQLELT